ncbi:polysaccharide pyruvyl transferase family protein [Bacillus sp. V3]|nr:polysaccharide pyruvyl transferase family protein [Bacillus sp. V3]
MKIVEIKGANFVNKGAELMLNSVILQLKEQYKDNVLFVTDYNTGDFRDRANLGLLQKFLLPKVGQNISNIIAGFIPKPLLGRYGVLKEKDIDIIIDCSGFAYSDQWGSKAALKMEKSCKRWVKQGKKIILLPQAFGPYNNEVTKNAMKNIFDLADLVFVRDEISLKHVESLVGNKSNIHRYPDFTNIVIKNYQNVNYQELKNRPCIVTNYRMIDKGKSSTAYIEFLKVSIEYLIENGHNPFFLIHDTGKDKEIVDKLNQQLSKELQIVEEYDALKIKEILGLPNLLISSRFHGLVSSLSQGVPCIASGWSHKYDELFKDYGCEEMVVKLDESKEEIIKKLDKLINETNYQELKNRIIKNAATQKNLTYEMWERVFKEIESKEVV